MNVSYHWLRSLVPTLRDGPHELAARLAMLGAAVDEVVELGAAIGEVVVARVEEVRPHPNADRLRLCSVDAGTGARLQVVCGADNVEAGGYYPFAPVGSSLPGGVSIRRAKLRGEVSEGMLCSPRELGLGRDHAGLMTLQGEWPVGAPLVEALGLDDARLVVDVTANRGDLLSHLGVAREVAPGGITAVELPAFPGWDGARLEIRATGASGETDGVRVMIEDPRACPRYLGAVVRGVRVAPSPEWLAGRLRAIGLRPINNVVDATNYVLFEMGQPLHAFDLEKLGREVRVRPARAGERIRTLDGVDRELQPGMLVIGDAERPVALAGVIGGEDTEVTASTSDVFLECAVFEPRGVRRTARALGLSTDASYRFERGVDPETTPRALIRAVELITAAAGGRIAGSAVDANPMAFQRSLVTLRVARVERLLGLRLSAEVIGEQLAGIGFDVEADGDGEILRVRVPGFRPDVTREVDLIEEVARRIGYDAIPEELLPFHPSSVPDDAMTAVHQRLKERFRGLGFLEARTVAFAPAAEHRVPLLNPLSAEESHLRDSLLPGLLRRVERNWARGVRDVRLLEIGAVFAAAEPPALVREEVRVALVLTGARRPPHWTGDAGAWDEWDLKALLDELATELRSDGPVPAGAEPAYALAAADTLLLLRAAGEVIGGGGRARAGEIDAPAWAEPVWVVEARIPGAAAASLTTRYRPLPEHPAVERDLALLMPERLSAAELEAAIRGAAGPLLESLQPFDVYTGSGIAPGTRSVAWRLRFRAPDRTLTDAEVDAAVTTTLKALAETLDVRRR